VKGKGHSKGKTRDQQNPASSIVRVGPLMGIPAVLRELGVDPEPIFASGGLTSTQFEDPDTELSYAPGSRLLARCVEAAGCEHFGLLVGMRADASCLGLPGFLLNSAPDVGAALRDLVENLDLHDKGGVPTLQISGDVVSIGYAIHQADVKAAEYIYDISMAQVCNIMRCLCGKYWKPIEVLLSRRQPQDLAPYRRFYRAPLRFNADQNAISFPSRWLDHKVPGANALLHQYLQREAIERHKLSNTGIVNEVRGLMRKSLHSGEFTVADIAKRLCLHERTLLRRLHEQGTSFRRELEGIRYDLSRQLLTDSTMPVNKIAKTLKYTNVSGFNRAFKRWSGITPGQWRTQHSHGQPISQDHEAVHQ